MGSPYNSQKSISKTFIGGLAWANFLKKSLVKFLKILKNFFGTPYVIIFFFLIKTMIIKTFKLILLSSFTRKQFLITKWKDTMKWLGYQMTQWARAFSPAVQLRIQTANPVAVDARIFQDCESAYSKKNLTVVCIWTREKTRAFASLFFCYWALSKSSSGCCKNVPFPMHTLNRILLPPQLAEAILFLRTNKCV